MLLFSLVKFTCKTSVSIIFFFNLLVFHGKKKVNCVDTIQFWFRPDIFLLKTQYVNKI